MMLYPSLTSLMENVNSRYLLVNVIAKRARSICEISESKNEPLDKKAVSSAIEEIAAGKIKVELED
ncbi:MAG: DNA-directed RNA polymerase subunit omega [Oscillospiraceae bacterium]|jgi:DNA-directed RNA polymerase subunit omega|nr:DNA-directed RNA polymerase subunit omega [Oscillospiraceae bacterium]